MKRFLKTLLLSSLLFSVSCTLLSKNQQTLVGLPADTGLALTRLGEAVEALKSGHYAAQLGALPAHECPVGVDLLICENVSGLNEEQRDFLRQFIPSAVPSLAAMSAENPHRVQATSDRGLMAESTGPSGPVLLYGPEVASYSLPRLMAVISQRMLEKSETMLGDYLLEASSFGPFPSADALGEAAAAALTVFSAMLAPLDPSCQRILVQNTSDRVFYAADAPLHPTGGPEACGRAWVADADDEPGLLTDGQAITDFLPGLSKMFFYLSIDNKFMDANTVADLYVMSNGAAISHRSVRRNEFSAVGKFEAFQLLADIPVGAQISFRVDWKRNSVLSFLGVRSETVPGARSFSPAWDYTKGAAQSVAVSVPGAFGLSPVASEPYVRKDLNLKDLPVGLNQVVFVVGGQSSVANTASHSVVELQVWEVEEHTLGGSPYGPPPEPYSADIQLKASKVLSASELYAGALAPHAYSLSFESEANKVYDFRVRIMGNLQSVTHYSTVVISNFEGTLPEEAVFSYAGSYYAKDSVRKSVCRYLNFNELQFNHSAVSDPSGVPVQEAFPLASGGGLCALVASDGTVFRVKKQVGSFIDPVVGRPESVPRTIYYRIDVASKKIRRCLSRLDLVDMWADRYPFEDVDNYPYIHGVERFAGYTEDTALSCTGAPLPAIPDFAADCVATSLSGTNGGHLCSTDATLNFEYRYGTPEPPAAYPFCTNLRYFGESINHYACADSDWGATWWNNLSMPTVYRPDAIWLRTNWTVNLPVFTTYLTLPENQWCVELVDYKTARYTNNEARGYFCTPSDRKLSYTPDEGKTWYHAFPTHGP